MADGAEESAGVTAKPTLAEWLSEAKAVNPDVSDGDLRRYWAQKYGDLDIRTLPAWSTWKVEAQQANPGVPESDLRSYWDEKYGALGAREQDPSNDLTRGFSTAFKQLPQLGYGLAAGAGATAEAAFGEGGIATGLKRFGLKGYLEKSKEIYDQSKASDDFTYSWEQAKEGNFGALVDWMQYGVGYMGGQAVQMLGTAGAGRAAGKIFEKPIENMAANLVNKEAAKLLAEGISADQIGRQAVANVAKKIGERTALAAAAVGMEGGEIFGELTEQAEKDGRTLSGDELAKAFGTTLAAGGLEFVGDKFGLDLILGKSATSRIGSRLGRTAASATAGALAEGGTEVGQTFLEQIGQGQDPTTDASVRDAINAGALGALGGGVLGGGVGGIRPAPSLPAPKPAPQLENIPASLGVGNPQIGVDDAIKSAFDLMEEDRAATERARQLQNEQARIGQMRADAELAERKRVADLEDEDAAAQERAQQLVRIQSGEFATPDQPIPRTGTETPILPGAEKPGRPLLSMENPSAAWMDGAMVPGIEVVSPPSKPPASADDRQTAVQAERERLKNMLRRRTEEAAPAVEAPTFQDAPLKTAAELAFPPEQRNQLKSQADIAATRTDLPRTGTTIPILSGPAKQADKPLIQTVTPPSKPPVAVEESPREAIAKERARLLAMRKSSQPVAKAEEQPPSAEASPDVPLKSAKDLAFGDADKLQALADKKGISRPVFAEMVKLYTGKPNLEVATPTERDRLLEAIKRLPSKTPEVTPDQPQEATVPEAPKAPSLEFEPTETNLVDAAEMASRPRSELVPEQNTEMMLRAEKAQADMDIAGRERGGRFFTEEQGQGGTMTVTGLKSPTAQWYKDLTKGPGKLSRQQIDTAIQKIIQDEGSDVGKAVERVKHALLQDREFRSTPWGEDAESIMRGEWPSWIPKPPSQTMPSEATSAEPPKAIPTPERTGTAPIPKGDAIDEDMREALDAGNVLDEEAHQAAPSPKNDRPEPTEAQKQSGVYKKGHVNISGLDISIENPEGSERSGTDRDGKPWRQRMTAHYGYIRSIQKDGKYFAPKDRTKEHIDIFVKPGTPEDYNGPVFVVDQKDPSTGKFDEYKIVMGVATEEEAKQAYLSNYAQDWKGFRSIKQFTMPEFKLWLQAGNKQKPVGVVRPEKKVETPAPTESAQPEAQQEKATDTEPYSGEPFTLTAQEFKQPKAKEEDRQTSLDIPPETIGSRPIIGRETTPEESPLFSKAAQEADAEQTAIPTEPEPARGSVTIAIPDTVRSVFETDVDGADYGDPELDQAFSILARSWNGDKLTFNPSDAESLAKAVNHLSNAYDDIAEGRTGATDTKAFSRRASSSLATLHGKILQNAAKPEPAKPASPTEILANALRTAADQIEGKQPEAPKPAATIATIADYDAFRKRLLDGQVTPEELKQAFAQTRDNKDALVAELNKLTKDVLLKRANSFSARMSDSKASLVDQAYRAMLSSYHLARGLSYNPMEKGGYERALSEAIDKTTAEDIANFAKEVEENTARRKQMIEGVMNPQTLEDFERRIRVKGEDSLSPEQLAKYDELLALAGREKRKKAETQQATVQGVQAGTDMTLVETVHTRDKHPLFVVKLADRVERDVYDRLNSAAKRLGGHYSSYAKGGAVPGFAFKTKEAAEQFMAAGKGETVSAVPMREARQAEVKDNAVSKLRDMADRLEGKADESLNADRQTNTVRRARMASHAENAAHADKALAQTMRNLADVIESGEATHLDGLKTKAQVEMLDSMLEVAKNDHVREQTKGSYAQYERERHRPATPEDAAFARFPQLQADRRALQTVVNDLKGRPGTDRLRLRFQKLMAQAKNDDENFPVSREDVELAIEKYPTSRFQQPPWHWTETLAKLKRLESMGITSLPELRAALREFVEYRGKRGTIDKAKQLERNLIGNKGIGHDFFPTPKATAERMVAEAGIEPGMKVLEPSAGNGNIAEAIKAAGVNPDVVEMSSALREILEAKGSNLVGRDFMDYTEGGYDRIVMNPPFSNGQDAEHIQHAYDLLKPGGKLVAIAGEGVFFRSDAKAQGFRNWLAAHNGTDEQLPEGTFTDKSLMATTGVNARMVVVEKPADVAEKASNFIEGVGLVNNSSSPPSFPNGEETGVNGPPIRDERLDPLSDESHAVEQAITGKRATEVAQFIAEQAPDPSHRLIASRVLTRMQELEQAGSDFAFHIAHEGEQVPRQLTGTRGATIHLFDSNRTDIWVQGADMKGYVGTSYEVVLHELVHAVTQTAVHLGERDIRDDSSLAQATFGLYKVLDAIKRHGDKRLADYRAGKIDLTQFEKYLHGINGANNATVNVDEVLAWGLTNRQFQEYLESIPYTPEKTMWQRFVMAIRNFLGLAPNADTALSEVLSLADKILDEPMIQLLERGKRHRVSFAYNTPSNMLVNNAVNRSAVTNAPTVTVQNPAPVPFRGDSKSFGELTDAQQRALQKVHGAPETWRKKLDSFRSDWKRTLTQGIFDQYAPIFDYSKKAYMLARLSKGGDGTLEALLLYGKPYVDADGAYQVAYTEGKPSGFAQVLADLKGEQDRFLEWVAAQRAERLKSVGLENLYTEDAIRDLKTLNQGKMKDGSSRSAAYEKALIQLNEWNAAMVKIAVDSGLISGETAQLFKDVPYVPFYRLEEEGVTGFGMQAGLVNQFAWKRLKGGTAHLNDDLLANLLQNWSHLITAGAKNRAAKATLDAASEVGVAQEVPSGAPGKGLVHYMEAGKAKTFAVSDPALLDAIGAMHYTGLGAIAKPFQAMKRALTFGVTVNPAFKIRNLIRDSIQAIGTSDLSFNPLENIAKGIAATKPLSNTRAQMLAGGGMIRFGTMLDGNNADRTRRLIEKGVNPDHILDGAGKIERFWKTKLQPAFDAYQELGDRGEQINRAALFEQLRSKGLSHLEASFMARDLLDFSLHGKWEAVRILSQVVPFANARLQGLRKLGVAAQEDWRRLGTVLGAVSLASVALLLTYQDDPDWKKREDWDRDNYFYWKFGDLAFRLPKPFEIGAVGTIAERAAELMISDEMTGARFADRLGATVSSQLSMNPIPQLVKPLIDLYANKDSFTDRPIETMGMERLRKEDRFTDRTSEAARLLGKLHLPDPTQLVMGRWESLSPVQIDSLVHGYFGWIGTASSTALDYGIRPLISDSERPDMPLKDVFLLGNFVEGLPSGSSRYVTQLYDQAKEIEQAYGSFRDAFKRGEIDRAKAIFEDEGDNIRKYKLVERVKRAEADIASRMKQIERSTMLSGEEKRRQLDVLRERKHLLAQSVAARVSP